MKALMLLAAVTLLAGCATYPDYRYQNGYYSGNVEYRSAYPAPYPTWGYDPYGPYSPYYYAPGYYYSGGVRYVRHGDRDDYRYRDHDHDWRDHDRHDHDRRHDRDDHRHRDHQVDAMPRQMPRQRKRPVVKERSYLDRNRRRVRGH